MPQMQTFSAVQIASLRTGGAILRDCLRHVASLVKPGVTTAALDAAAEAFIRSHGGVPAFKGYHHYPATLCISLNDEAVHGLPGPRTIKDGDIVSLDGGVRYDGLCTDACITIPVGEVSTDARRLLTVTRDALDAGVAQVRAGGHVGDVSAAIQAVVEGGGCAVIRPLTGHGLGDTVHQFPDIPNYGKRGAGPVFSLHTLIAIEPITTLGTGGMRELDDGWTISTSDGALAAHEEHTLLVTEDGCEVIA